MVRDVGVLVRIEDLVVDAIDDPVQLVRVGTDELIEPFPVLGHLHLGGVALADGVDDVGVVNAAAEHVDDVVEAGDADADQTPFVQAGQRERAEAEDSLGREVVDGEGGGDLRGGALRIYAVDQVGHERREPVVDVDDVGRELQGRQHLEQRAREVDRPGVVVAEAVDAVAVVKLRAVDEVNDHVPEPAFEDGRRHRLRAQRDREVVYYSLQVVLADVDLSVSRHHDAHVVTQAAQLLRQRGGDVGHAA